MESKRFWDFVFELGQLRRIKHEGWRLIGVEHPESVADHSLRVAQIAFVLAHLEGDADPFETAVIGLFHDIGECRIGDVHRVASRYVTRDEARAVQEQTERLDDDIGQKIFGLWKQAEERSTKAGTIAKDADYLEQAAMAKEFIEKGHAHAQGWVNNIAVALRTESAKKMLAEIVNSNSNDWWQGLKKLT